MGLGVLSIAYGYQKGIVPVQPKAVSLGCKLCKQCYGQSGRVYDIRHLSCEVIITHIIQGLAICIIMMWSTEGAACPCMHVSV